jgi:Protein of unknown function (DUF3592)
MSSPDKHSLWNDLAVFAFFLLLLAAGLYLLSDTAVRLFRAEASRTWPTTRASIRTVRSSSFGNRRIVVRYSYRVAGVSYDGTAVELPHLSTSELYDAANSGQPVPVHYDPQSPEVSVLDPGFTWTAVIWSLGGLQYVGLGIAGMWVILGLEARRRRVRLRHAA